MPKFGPALVVALVACSVTFAQDVRTNYMPGTDFSKYHTYAWVNYFHHLAAKMRFSLCDLFRISVAVNRDYFPYADFWLTSSESA